MAEVKWIKISTNIFDDEAIELIEQMPEGDAILVIWFKLLAKAGKTNNGGLVYFKDNIPYTEEMLSTVFKKPINIIRLALQVFEKFGMIEITSTNEILITNWEKHQNIAGLEQIKEYNRLAKRKQREKKKLLQAESQILSLTSQGQVKDIHETDKDKDIDIELDKEEDNNNTFVITDDIQEFFELYNFTVKRLPKATKLSDARKRKIKARLKNADLDTWKKVFEKCDQSDFCAGVKTDWKANFDWLIANDNNYVKVLEGKYDNNFSLRNDLSSLQSKGMDIL